MRSTLASRKEKRNDQCNIIHWWSGHGEIDSRWRECSIYIMTARELIGLTAKLFVQSMCCLNGYVILSTHKLVPTAVTPASLSAELSLGRGVASLSHVYLSSLPLIYLILSVMHTVRWPADFLSMQSADLISLKAKSLNDSGAARESQTEHFEKHMPKGLFGRSV